MAMSQHLQKYKNYWLQHCYSAEELNNFFKNVAASFNIQKN